MRAAKNKRKKKELKLAYLKKQGLLDKSKHFEKDDDDTGFFLHIFAEIARNVRNESIFMLKW